MNGKITPPFAEQDLKAILNEWSTFVPADSPINVYLGGSAALILCAGLRGYFSVIARRKAKDIDFYIDTEASEKFLQDLVALGRRIGTYGLDWYFPFDRGLGPYMAPFVAEREKYFYTPSTLNDSKTTGLIIHVFKEAAQLTLKIDFANKNMNAIRAFNRQLQDSENSKFDTRKQLAMEEAILLTNLIDISLLCKIEGVEGAVSLRRIWEQYKSPEKSAADQSTFEKQWRMIEFIRTTKLDLTL